MEPRGHSPQQFVAIIESETDKITTFQKIYFKKSHIDITLSDFELNEKSEKIESWMLYDGELYRDDLKKRKKSQRYFRKPSTD